MGEVIIREVKLPTPVKGITILDCDTNYNVYINSELSPHEKLKALLHELQHIKRCHLLDCEKVQKNEKEANMA